MGGLWKKMPITFWTFLIGTLALAGVPPLSGFYSKDEILVLAFEHNKCLFAMGVGAAVLTAFYIGREVFVVFCGKPRWVHSVAMRPACGRRERKQPQPRRRATNT